VKRFQFNLQAPLKYREGRRDLCRQLLAQILADERACRERCEALENQRRRLLGELREINGDGNVDVDRAASRRFFASHLSAEIGLAQRNCQVVEQQLDVCRQALRKADQDVQSLEKLRDKHLAEFLYRQDRAEAHELEETWAATSLARMSQ